ncbi:MAG: membrane protein insertion efficiency factor YidD [Desulfamplus sp.]|nr:membrane protein insertion efficiency factor YidD [Desulfamplus sp.]MBF0257311.1 membrane protein insertion efficiency factor YidD [Desulfamplus sp.]
MILMIDQLSVSAEPIISVGSGTDIVGNPLKNKNTNLFFQLYRDVISPADGDRCGMSPSCSKYGQEAFTKHGLFMGWIMTCDRLIRCGRDERSFSPSVVSNGKDGSQRKVLIFDPLDANDFWWYPHDSSR